RCLEFLCGIDNDSVGALFAEQESLHCIHIRRLAPGYIGWAAQAPGGVQLGLAFRHRASRSGVPDIDGLLRTAGARLGLPAGLRPTGVRAGLIPRGGAAAPLAGDRAILTGDAAGPVSPVPAGGIHSAWRPGGP